MSPMRLMTLAVLVLGLGACAAGSVPTGPGTGGNPGGGGTPAVCPWNAAIPASDPACVAPPVPKVVGLLVKNSTDPGDPKPADSTYTAPGYYMPFVSDPEHRWSQAPVVYAKLSNGDVQVWTAHKWIPIDTALLDVREGAEAFRGKADGCTKVRLVENTTGIETWIWVALTWAKQRCP